MDNMKIYEAGRAVPNEAQKSFNNGRFSGTDINPMWRIKKLTELFGPAGIGWYYEVVSERSEAHGDTVMAIVDLNLFIREPGTSEWSKPIYGTGGNVLLAKGRASDEGYKMALTDALSVACKALGIGADVYFDKDKTKYTAGDGGTGDPSPTGNGGRPMTAPASGGRKSEEAGAPGRQTRMGEEPCRRCKTPIDARTAEYSRTKYNMPLCRDCQTAYEEYLKMKAERENNEAGGE